MDVNGLACVLASRPMNAPNPVLSAIRKWNELFSGAGTRLAVLSLDAIAVHTDEAHWVPALGLIARVMAIDTETYEGPSADLLIVPPSKTDRVDVVLASVGEALEALKTDAGARARLLEGDWKGVLGLSPVVASEDAFESTPLDVERRTRALETSLGRFDAVERRMKDVYGLRLPRHVAVWDAFCKSLSSFERAGLEHVGRSPVGVLEVWFGDGGLDRMTRDGLDPRLEMRFRCDPPEFVTIMGGDSDGLHYGLWYDDPSELPTCLAYNYARDSAETSFDERTAIRHIGKRVAECFEGDDAEADPPLSLMALRAAVSWFAVADDKALSDDGDANRTTPLRGQILAGPGPVVPANAGNPRASSSAADHRSDAYRDESRREEVLAWIAKAKEELAGGQPAYALTLGRELHWLDSDDYRTQPLDLLTSAYEALGRPALAAIARVHHQHRDLATVGVFE
jgi:hypothetical protein